MSKETEALTVKNGQAAIATVAVSGTLSPKSSPTDVVTIVDTSDGKQAALKVYNLNGGGGGGGGEVSGDYLPLSGGTLTGTLKSNVPNFTKSLDLPGLYVERRSISQTIFGLGHVSLVGDTDTLRPYLNNDASLGDSTYKWKNIYTHKINNGADLIVPTEGGTLARLEDLEGIGGGGDFLPLSGGTLTGPLSIQDAAGTTFGTISNFGGGLQFNYASTDNAVFRYEGYSLYPATNGLIKLGDVGKSWAKVYAQNLNNGADIAIPTTGGTMVVNGASVAGGIALGNNSQATQATATAVGSSANAGNTYTVSVGAGSAAERLYATAIGGGAKATANYATQLGNGTNSDANTFKVANSNGNFEMMSADGTIPAARHATLPTEDGTYVLKCVVVDGVATTQWVLES